MRHGRDGHRVREARRRQRSKGLPCYLCGQPIDYSAGPDDPLAFNLEHVIPLSVAPELALDPSNHRSAHRRCNRAKGAGPAVVPTRTSRAWL